MKVGHSWNFKYLEKPTIWYEQISLVHLTATVEVHVEVHMAA